LLDFEDKTKCISKTFKKKPYLWVSLQYNEPLQV
jgi:hypothetical protein